MLGLKLNHVSKRGHSETTLNVLGHLLGCTVITDITSNSTTCSTTKHQSAPLMVDDKRNPSMTDGYLSEIASKAKCVFISWHRHNVAFNSLFTLIICFIDPCFHIFILKLFWYLYWCIILLRSNSCIYIYIYIYTCIYICLYIVSRAVTFANQS